MKEKKSVILSFSVFAFLIFAPSFVSAQQKEPATLRQDSAVAANDTVIQGTVVSFTANSATPPIGPHVVVQTTSGNVDVHLGNARLLKQANISLAAGDSVRIAGSNISFNGGTIFAARILQKCNQSVTLRSPRGIPLRRSSVALQAPQSMVGPR